MTTRPRCTYGWGFGPVDSCHADRGLAKPLRPEHNCKLASCTPQKPKALHSVKNQNQRKAAEGKQRGGGGGLI